MDERRFRLEEKSKVDEQFVADLETIQKGALPKADYVAADARLNAEFKAVMAKDKKEANRMAGEVEAQGIRETEQWAWIEYRDAWVAFSSVAFPGRHCGTEWRTWITRQRIAQLRNVE